MDGLQFEPEDKVGLDRGLTGMAADGPGLEQLHEGN